MSSGGRNGRLERGSSNHTYPDDGRISPQNMTAWVELTEYCRDSLRVGLLYRYSIIQSIDYLDTI